MFSGADERQIPHGITPFAQVVMISPYINGPRIAILEGFVAPLRPILLGQLSVTQGTRSASSLCYLEFSATARKRLIGYIFYVSENY